MVFCGGPLSNEMFKLWTRHSLNYVWIGIDFPTIFSFILIVSLFTEEIGFSIRLKYKICLWNSSSYYAIFSTPGKMEFRTITKIIPPAHMKWIAPCYQNTQWHFLCTSLAFSLEMKCSGIIFILSVSPCTNNPCENGGTCNVVDGMASCDCLNDWSGNTCTGRYQS